MNTNLFGDAIDEAEVKASPKKGTLIFKFLEAWRSGNAPGCLRLLHGVTEREPVELVVGLLGRQLRDLYWVKSGGKGLAYPDWRAGKLKKQAAGFSEKELGAMIAELAEIDVKAKRSEVEILPSLDLMIMAALE